MIRNVLIFQINKKEFKIKTEFLKRSTVFLQKLSIPYFPHYFIFIQGHSQLPPFGVGIAVKNKNPIKMDRAFENSGYVPVFRKTFPKIYITKAYQNLYL